MTNWPSNLDIIQALQQIQVRQHHSDQRILELLSAYHSSEQRLATLERRQEESGQWAASFVAMHQAQMTLHKSLRTDFEEGLSRLERLYHGLSHELPKLALPIAEFRTEIAALSNRLRFAERAATSLASRFEEAIKFCNQTDVNQQQISGRLEQALESRSAAIEMLVEERAALLRSEISAAATSAKEMSAAAEERIGAALANFETELQKVPTEISEIRREIASLSEEKVAVAGISSHLDSIKPEIDSIKSSLSPLVEKMDEIEKKPHLFLTNADRGIFILKSHDLISMVVAREGNWDDHIVALLDDVASTRGDGVALDIGAQFGLITVPMAQRFSRVLCFEPNDFNFKLLKANVALNGLTNVECRNHPLFSSEVALSLGQPELQETAVPHKRDGSFDPMAAQNSASYLFSQYGSGTYPHQACTLDSLELDGVVFIKIDVQGADGEVLMGARDTLQRCKPVVTFEWEDELSTNFSVTLDVLKQELKSLGYGLHLLRRHNKKQADYVAYPAPTSPTRRSARK